MKERSFTIGQMANLCNLSTDQLRHYDKEGLISPKIRGDNNYRYYSERQIEDLLLIKELKNAGLPLKSIADLIGDKNIVQVKEALENLLPLQRQKLREAEHSYDTIVDYLLKINEALPVISASKKRKANIRDSFEIIPIAERPTVYTRYESNCGVNDTFIYRYTELQNLIERENIRTANKFFLLFHDHFDRQFLPDDQAIGDLEIFANITGTMGSSDFCRMFGGFLAASATHVGPYRKTKRVYEEMCAWIEEMGYHTSGQSFQELIIDRRITSDENSFVTKIYLPLNVESF